jgi:hypothetical protein
LYLVVLVIAPVAHASHVFAVRLVLLVACSTKLAHLLHIPTLVSRYQPSAKTTSLSNVFDSLRPSSDSCHEL